MWQTPPGITEKSKRSGELVRSCPWAGHTKGKMKCLTIECAIYGPRFTITNSLALRLVNSVVDLRKDGKLHKGDRVLISNTGSRKCPMAYALPVTGILLRYSCAAGLDLEVDGCRAYLIVTDDTAIEALGGGSACRP